MLTRTQRKCERAITRNEVIVIVVVLFFVGAALMPVLSRARPSARIKCVTNLKQVGLAFRVFAMDNDDKYPFNSPTRDHNGSKIPNAAYTNETDAWLHMVIMSNELGSAKILMCPTDRDRLNNMAVDFSSNSVPPNFGVAFQRNNALSYFVGLDADETTPQVLLAGDRDLETNRFTLVGSVLSVTSNRPPVWMARLHGTNGGNIALSDGSVELVVDASLRSRIEASPLATNRLLLPLK